jgi:DNA-binding transcriptional regulator/RsmH inhibitor MraZ
MTNGLLEAGTYTFDAEGRLYIPEEVKNGLVKDSDGEIRYYVNGVATYVGLVQDAEGNFYYINSSLKAVKNCSYTIYAHMTNGLLEAGTYTFDAEGRLLK